MAKVSYVDLLPAEEILYYLNLNAQSRFIHAHVAKKNLLLSKKRIAGLTQKSLLPQVAAAWGLLSDAVKLDWKNAAALCGMTNGYRLFVQDKIIRIKNEIAGNAVPSLLHQSWVGALTIESPASEIKITQLHPREYWVYHKVYGKKGMYEPVEVLEDLTPPFKISLNYSADLTDLGSGFAKFYAIVYTSFQGTIVETEKIINLDLSCGWKNAEATLTSIAGYVVGYDLFFHLDNVRGTLYIDNVKAEHSGQNWVRDTFCKDIQQGFTKAFYQIPKHWVYDGLFPGTDFESIYKDF
jgi:hypothetical protein